MHSADVNLVGLGPSIIFAYVVSSPFTVCLLNVGPVDIYLFNISIPAVSLSDGRLPDVGSNNSSWTDTCPTGIPLSGTSASSHSLTYLCKD